MIDFLHNYQPSTTVISLGPVHIYWYGLFIVAGILSALSIALKLAKKVNISQNDIFDLAFWLIIFGIVGARAYHVFLETGYYLKHPLDIIKIWEGGLAIHGAMIAGLITVFIFCKKQKMNFWLTAAIIAPGLALGQAIGRWGNYFNQELFGYPTNLPWGIPIDILKRPHRYISSEYFHPTFLYESLGNLAIFAVLLFLLLHFFKKSRKDYDIIMVAYLMMYSILRFSMEFIRIDRTPQMLGLRWPQIASIIIVIACIIYIFWKGKKKGVEPETDTALEKEAGVKEIKES